MNDFGKSDLSRRIVLLALVAAVLGVRLARERSGPPEEAPVGNALSRTAVVPAVTAIAGTDPALCDPALGTGGTAEQQLAAQNARRDSLAKARAFTAWLTDWRRASTDELSARAASGYQLALERRAALKYLIQTDPRSALELAVPVGLRAELPAEIQAQLEQRLDARGDLDVTVACIEGRSVTLRSATIAGQH